jgi:hypothetical protein
MRSNASLYVSLDLPSLLITSCNQLKTLRDDPNNKVMNISYVTT